MIDYLLWLLWLLYFPIQQHFINIFLLGKQKNWLKKIEIFTEFDLKFWLKLKKAALLIVDYLLWLGLVYNVTEYFEFHPGGEDELMRGIGIDATEIFDQVS